MKSKLNVEMIAKAIDEIVKNTKKKVAEEIFNRIKEKGRARYLLSEPPKIMLEILSQDLIQIIQEVQEE